MRRRLLPILQKQKQTKYPGYLTSIGARVCTVAIGAKLTLCKSENVLISKSFTMFKSRYVSPSHQKCGLLFGACISTAALQTVGQAKHRADRKQGRGRVSQTAVKTPVETHIPNALNARPKNAPKTWIISAYPSCLRWKFYIQYEA